MKLQMNTVEHRPLCEQGEVQFNASPANRHRGYVQTFLIDMQGRNVRAFAVAFSCSGSQEAVEARQVAVQVAKDWAAENGHQLLLN